jgi:hypothetical protein
MKISVFAILAAVEAKAFDNICQEAVENYPISGSEKDTLMLCSRHVSVYVLGCCVFCNDDQLIILVCNDVLR